MNSIDKELELNLSNFSSFGMSKKFRFIISSSNLILQSKNKDESLIKSLLSKIEGLRYEMSYDKGYESLSNFGIDYVLAYEALKLSRVIFKGKDLIKFINDVLYYEINDGMKEELQKEISEII
jgi:hypothetical protein